ncbi:SDR family oxidoreductase [Comamonas humi]
MSRRLHGKVALITGGSMGMGASHARACVAEGAQVVIADIADEPGQALARELGDAAHYVHLDITQPAQWQQAVAATLGRFGKLNVLVNNAGILTYGPVLDYTLEQWNRTLAVNLTGQFLGIQACVPALAEAAPASIINVSSTAGLSAYPFMAGYGASKWGVRGLTKSVALELAERRIRVNSVHPGAVATAQSAALRQGQPSDPDASSLKRFAEPEEISPLIVYLASDESRFSTGAEFVADGGITAGSLGG